MSLIHGTRAFGSSITFGVALSSACTPKSSSYFDNVHYCTSSLLLGRGAKILAASPLPICIYSSNEMDLRDIGTV